MFLIKKIVIYLFIFQVITADQLAKIPLLVHHYYEHSEKHDLNFATFLSLHYLNQKGDGDDHDDETDRNLPFKNIDHVTFQLVSNLTNTVLFEPTVTPENKTLFYYQASFSIRSLSNLIKPPSIV
jgi:hypothetical protein